MHFCTASNTFVTFCFAEHFPLENVQHHIFQRKMFSIFVFCKTKNTAFLQSQMYATQKVKKQSIAKNKDAEMQRIKYIFARKM